MKATSLIVVVGALLAPLFAMASGEGYCEKWKGREFLSSSRGVFESRGSQCIGYCALTLTDVSGPVARWEISGQWCSRSSGKSAPVPSSQAVGPSSVQDQVAPEKPWAGPVRSITPKGELPETGPFRHEARRKVAR